MIQRYGPKSKRAAVDLALRRLAGEPLSRLQGRGRDGPGARRLFDRGGGLARQSLPVLHADRDVDVLARRTGPQAEHGWP
ncbi:MAG: type II toxin-antitoxin system VapB family antitoxin [Actinomycetota bacterium]|nr:type II toxin-antitoxin system VapB family antitoxin [Actinomycetota bacterium]